jgi:serine protease Do
MKYRLMSFLICGLVVSTITAGMAAEDQRETPLVRAVKRAAPSVVNIHTEKTTVERDTVFNTGSSKPRKVNGMGTGVVIDERGYIVTNYHVIADVDLIRATFEDDSQASASVVSFDRDHDLALIRVNVSKPLKVMPSGTSSDLMLGEDVIAVGNAFGYSHTVTKGIISSLGRDVEVNDTQSYKNLIQTDASINPGNSGGPLLNLNGEVVGINVAIRAGAQRIGFAIPIDDARRIVARLISIEQLNHNYHGLVTKDYKVGATRKLIVDSVLPESPAAKAGLKSGDVIVKLNDREIVDAVDWERACLDHKSDESLNVVVRRGEALENTQLALATYIGGRSRIQPEIVARANNDSNEADRFWRVIGVRVATLPTDKAGVVPAKYRGGLVISEVRAQSPAALNGIKKDDILVGLRDWETLSVDNITWILNQPMIAGQNGLKFLVIRGQETLYGHLQTAGLDAKSTAIR